MTNELNTIATKKQFAEICEYFKELPIEIIDIDIDDKIMESQDYCETPINTFGFKIHGKKLRITRTSFSYALNFLFNGQKNKIYLNDSIMNNKVALINSMKFDLGLR